MAFEPSGVPDHESPVRRMISEAHGTPFHPLKTLDDAQHCEDGVAILEGDYGGQIYAVIPARLIKCSADALGRLLLTLDSIAWDDVEGTAVYYERRAIGDGVAGGMGGGMVSDDLWLHDDLRNVFQQVRDYVAGIRDTIELPGD